VVLFELTGGLTYVVPVMLAVLLAKWTGDALTGGRSICDVHGELKGFAKVEQSDDFRLLNATLRDLQTSSCAAGVEEAQAAETIGEAIPPALWISGTGRVRARDLAAHCSATSASGFAVLVTDTRGEVEVLGWANAALILEALAAMASIPPGKGDGISKDQNRWCRLAPRPRPGYPADDFSEFLEARAVVRVRSDCPLQTALCVFQSCPGARALVSLEGCPLVARTITRELFTYRLLNHRLHALPPPPPTPFLGSSSWGLAKDIRPASAAVADALVEAQA